MVGLGCTHLYSPAHYHHSSSYHTLDLKKEKKSRRESVRNKELSLLEIFLSFIFCFLFKRKVREVMVREVLLGKRVALGILGGLNLQH